MIVLVYLPSIPEQGSDTTASEELHGLGGSWGLDEVLLKQFASQSSGTLLKESWEAKLIGQSSKEKTMTD
eukprot:77932-Amphidinium_carterae.1